MDSVSATDEVSKVWDKDIPSESGVSGSTHVSFPESPVYIRNELHLNSWHRMYMVWSCLFCANDVIIMTN